ncbi:hypothetical protein [Paracoccus cavernae]|uniref:hypothetical protein n=1 Tax=Paracoccus cavernae TaxID=1571207 RepID=UPI0035F4ED46
MANEDPSGIPEQIRQTRPFMIALAIAFVVGIGTFLWILSQDVNENDLERTDPPAALVTPPAATPDAATTTPETAAPAPAAPATSN